MLQKWSGNCHSKSQKSLWTLVNRYLRFVTLDNARKSGLKFFLHWTACLFFKIFCFQESIRCYRNDLLISTVNVRIPCGPLLTFRQGLSHSMVRGQIGQNLFFTGKFAFFFKKDFVSNKLLGVTEMFFKLPQ